MRARREGARAMMVKLCRGDHLGSRGARHHDPALGCRAEGRTVKAAPLLACPGTSFRSTSHKDVIGLRKEVLRTERIKTSLLVGVDTKARFNCRTHCSVLLFEN